MSIVPTRSLVLFIRVWMGSMAGQIAARMGIRVKDIAMHRIGIKSNALLCSASNVLYFLLLSGCGVPSSCFAN